MTDLQDFVLACTNPPSIWNMFPSLEAASAAAEEANAYNVKLEAHSAPKRHYEPMTYADYKAKEREFYLSDPEARTHINMRAGVAEKTRNIGRRWWTPATAVLGCRGRDRTKSRQ